MKEALSGGLWPFEPKGSIVKPIDSLKVFSSEPSAWFGNTFNTELGTIDTSIDYKVVDFESLASFGGPQLWVKLQPLVESAAGATTDCGKGCWAFLGAKSSEIVHDASGEAALKYGNFLFQQLKYQ